MVQTLPGRVLALGTHVADEYPDALREPAEVELTQLLGRFEPVPPAPDDCGARDWSDLGQRMHYIVHLFRAFHLHDELSSPPFTPEQEASIDCGALPEGGVVNGCSRTLLTMRDLSRRLGLDTERPSPCAWRPSPLRRSEALSSRSS